MVKLFNIRTFLGRSIVLSLSVCLVVLVFSQVLLLIPSVGGSLPASGVTAFEQIKSPTGKILVEMVSGYQPSSNIKILVNGNETASLSTQSIELTVMNNSVVEIDARKTPYPIEVTVHPLDSNTKCDGNYAAAEGNIVRLTRVFAAD